jgi:hypothetical protein
MLPAPTQGKATRHPLLTIAAIAGVAVLFCWPAFYNGFPLVYGDTASYLDTIDPRKTLWARQIFYTGFLRLLHWHISLWPAVLVQSLLTAHLLYLTLRALRPQTRLVTYIAVAAVLALTTSLPWHTSALLPDFFTPIVVLGLFLLAFCRERLSMVETVYVAGVTALAIVAHLSHIPLAVGLIVTIALTRLALRWREQRRMATALLLVLPVFAAASTHLSLNYAFYRSFSLSPASSIWLLARFIGDGPARAYLHDQCPTRPFILCAYLDQLPSDSDEFLWGDDSYNPVFKRAGGYAALRDEAGEIVSGTFAAYPGWILRSFIANTWREFVDVGTGGWINFPPQMLNRPITKYIQNQFPKDYPAYRNSPQVNSRIPTAALAAWHRAVIVAAALACCVLLGIAIRRRQRLFIALCALVLAALIGNAMVTGGFSAVHDRYQTRVAWLIVFAATVGALTCLRGMRLTTDASRMRASFPDYGPAE